MELDLSPKFDQSHYDGDGGSHTSWSSSDLPMLKHANVGAGKFILEPLGSALPHYADSSKISYIIQGNIHPFFWSSVLLVLNLPIDDDDIVSVLINAGKGMAGLVAPQDPKEKVVRLEKGDTIQVPLGVVSWWYSDGESEMVIIFLSDTSQALVPGKITYFFLAGDNGLLNGFTIEFRKHGRHSWYNAARFKLVAWCDANSLPEHRA